MLRYAKRAEARITYAVAWSPGVTPASPGSRPIAASGWTIEPEEPGGLALADAALDDRCARAAFTGGRPGTTYIVRNTVALAGGGDASRELAIGVAR